MSNINTIYELQELITLKNDLVSNLKDRGIECSESETLTALVDKVSHIGLGVQFDKYLNGTLKELYDDTIYDVRNYACYYCTTVEKIIMPNKIQISGNYAFAYMTNLKEVYFKKCEVISDVLFNNSISIKKIYFPKITVTRGGSNFSTSSKDTLESIVWGNYAFPGGLFSTTASRNATMIVLNCNKVNSVASANYLPKIPLTAGTCFIYVPRALVNSYKTANNWSVYANQFRAIEDYKDLICTEYPDFSEDFIGEWDND